MGELVQLVARAFNLLEQAFYRILAVEKRLRELEDKQNAIH
jgi:hypothetical protein